NYNGFKISAALAKPVGGTTGLTEILTIAQTAGPLGSKEVTGSYNEQDIWDVYRKHILKFLTIPAKPIKVFIDGSNGMAGKLIPKVFTGVKNLEIVDVNFEITGSFVHEPNPLVAENMIPTQQGVVANKAHFGACFDGDADRCMVTDELGNIIGCDILTALLSGHFLAQAPGATVIYDLRSSKVVEETIIAANAKPQKGRVGHVFMKQSLRETNGIFGGELSGHFYFRDNYYADSGAIAFAAIVSVLGQTDTPLSELIAPFKKYPQSGEINFRTADKDAVLAGLKKEYGSRGIFEQLDGVSFDLWDGEGFWFNVRASNTEPLLRLNAEAKDQETLDTLLSVLMPKLGEVAEGH
ncbi:MAG: phosphomannomutase/phosphoglucomutase, partial [Phycisphaeraceae bacterium]|nr:phosphomannomutase/phosphoglucomutase [Phycisphaeraceae bacterium]